MMFYLIPLLTMLGFGFANQNINFVVQDKEIKYTTNGILRTILNNRDFGSNSVTFSEWRDLNNELYIVPFTAGNNNVPALGLGYRIFNNEKIGHTTLNFGNEVEIREQNITAMGFPQLWKKADNCDVDTGDIAKTFYPLGTRKFRLNEVNNQSLEFTKADNVAEVEDGIEYVKRSNEFSDTETFLFFGIGNINDTDRSVAYETLVKYVTIHTTTTLTSTYGIPFFTSTAPIEFFSATENGLELLMPVTTDIMLPTTTIATPFLVSKTEKNALSTSVLIAKPIRTSKMYQESFSYSHFTSATVVPTSSLFKTKYTWSEDFITKNIMGNNSVEYTSSRIKPLHSLNMTDNGNVSSSLYLSNPGPRYLNISSENDGSMLNQYQSFNSVTGMILFFITSFILM